MQFALANTDFYAECIPAFSAANGETFRLASANNKCRNICERECQAFSRKFDPYKMIGSASNYVGIYELELNQDVITDCFQSCQKGDLYEKKDGKLIVAQDKDVGGAIKYKSRYFQAFQESCGANEDHDYFHKICVNDKG